MLTDRIMGAITFKKGVYSEVANDPSFTPTAWLIVAVVQLLTQLGTRASLVHQSSGFLRWIFGTIVYAALGVGGFALSAFLVSWAARQFFKANFSFEQAVRSLGLAHIWNVVGLLGIVAVISAALLCVVSPITLIAGLAGLAATLIAIKEASGMDWTGTIVSILVVLVVTLVIAAIAGGILAVIGIGTSLIRG